MVPRTIRLVEGGIILVDVEESPKKDDINACEEDHFFENLGSDLMDFLWI
jgi:hypothetical protein